MVDGDRPVGPACRAEGDAMIAAAAVSFREQLLRSHGVLLAPKAKAPALSDRVVEAMWYGLQRTSSGTYKKGMHNEQSEP
jgi:hypothetical protein